MCYNWIIKIAKYCHCRLALFILLTFLHFTPSKWEVFCLISNITDLALDFSETDGHSKKLRGKNRRKKWRVEIHLSILIMINGCDWGSSEKNTCTLNNTDLCAMYLWAEKSNGSSGYSETGSVTISNMLQESWKQRQITPCKCKLLSATWELLLRWRYTS